VGKWSDEARAEADRRQAAIDAERDVKFATRIEATRSRAQASWDRGDRALVVKLEGVTLTDSVVSEHLNAALAVGWHCVDASVAVSHVGTTIYLFTLVDPRRES
jgi:4-hydroxyphenylpyruvate dioxygenase-like putative hemolysin